MGRKTKAYVDTSALIAIADRSDTYYPLFRHLFAEPSDLVTTTLVVAEGHGSFLKRYDRTLALRFLAMVESIPVERVPFGPSEQTRATQLLREFSDQDLPLTDAAGLLRTILREN